MSDITIDKAAFAFIQICKDRKLFLKKQDKSLYQKNNLNRWVLISTLKKFILESWQKLIEINFLEFIVVTSNSANLERIIKKIYLSKDKSFILNFDSKKYDFGNGSFNISTGIFSLNTTTFLETSIGFNYENFKVSSQTPFSDKLLGNSKATFLACIRNIISGTFENYIPMIMGPEKSRIIFFKLLTSILRHKKIVNCYWKEEIESNWRSVTSKIERECLLLLKSDFFADWNYLELNSLLLNEEIIVAKKWFPTYESNHFKNVSCFVELIPANVFNENPKNLSDMLHLPLVPILLEDFPENIDIFDLIELFLQETGSLLVASFTNGITNPFQVMDCIANSNMIKCLNPKLVDFLYYNYKPDPIGKTNSDEFIYNYIANLCPSTMELLSLMACLQRLSIPVFTTEDGVKYFLGIVKKSNF